MPPFPPAFPSFTSVSRWTVIRDPDGLEKLVRELCREAQVFHGHSAASALLALDRDRLLEVLWLPDGEAGAEPYLVRVGLTFEETNPRPEDVHADLQTLHLSEAHDLVLAAYETGHLQKIGMLDYEDPEDPA